MKTIAHIHTNFPEKFGIPRQSGIVDTPGHIVFEPPYNNPDAVRGLEEFSHIWLIWEFSDSKDWSPTVRPPRLGGNTRVGVFASRSPYRPNPIGLSCVELEKIEFDSKLGPVLHVRGADIKDGTPIFDIKPYLPYSEAKTDARGGFAHKVKDDCMEVVFMSENVECAVPEEIPREKNVECAVPREKNVECAVPKEISKELPQEDRNTIEKLLAQDPRPHYQNDPDRIYGMAYKNLEVKFRAEGRRIIVTEIFAARGK